ncbi:MAG: short-chain dehydrogenase [Rhodococcus erythropolis]|jgi:NAD(P)-dependent dehydrogenase (short-subunit alcohol dehydrogenase family)|nr:glucose 1-dehydrogenase [Rhodococcus erythropolis]MDF2893461.1 short-chain dehydrogenase [Rhodococcus erythropolis]
MPTASARPLAGKRALVTGASKGIGAQIAHAFAQAGADVIVSGRSRCELTTLADRLRDSFAVRAEILVADLALPDAPTQVAQESLAVFGGLDVLVNNAGISYPEFVTDITEPNFDAVLNVNLRAPALLAAKIGSAMADAGGGAIVTVASAAALRALPEHYSYCIAKAGLVMATKVLALELGSRGVRANSVCPTVVLTEMGQTVWGEHDKAAPMLNRIPTGRFAMPDEVSEAVVWLASDAAAMVNGTELPIDGGYLVS